MGPVVLQLTALLGSVGVEVKLEAWEARVYNKIWFRPGPAASLQTYDF